MFLLANLKFQIIMTQNIETVDKQFNAENQNIISSVTTYSSAVRLITTRRNSLCLHRILRQAQDKFKWA